VPSEVVEVLFRMLECRSRRELKVSDEGKVLWERKRREKMGLRERERKEKESQRQEEESANAEHRDERSGDSEGK